MQATLRLIGTAFAYFVNKRLAAGGEAGHGELHGAHTAQHSTPQHSTVQRRAHRTTRTFDATCFRCQLIQIALRTHEAVAVAVTVAVVNAPADIIAAPRPHPWTLRLLPCCTDLLDGCQSILFLLLLCLIFIRVSKTRGINTLPKNIFLGIQHLGFRR